jgi:hypothetical protein
LNFQHVSFNPILAKSISGYIWDLTLCNAYDYVKGRIQAITAVYYKYDTETDLIFGIQKHVIKHIAGKKRD